MCVYVCVVRVFLFVVTIQLCIIVYHDLSVTSIFNSERLCKQLTDYINAGNTADAKRTLGILFNFDRGQGRFQAKCLLQKPQYMYVALCGVAVVLVDCVTVHEMCCIKS